MTRALTGLPGRPRWPCPSRPEPRRHADGGSERALQLEQPALSVQATGVAAKRPAAAQHAVARHDDRDRVRAERVAGCARAARAAGLGGDLRVAEHAAVRDRRGRAQHAPAEGPDERPIERQVEVAPAPGEVLVELTAERIGRAPALRRSAARSARRGARARRRGPPRGTRAARARARSRPPAACRTASRARRRSRRQALRRDALPGPRAPAASVASLAARVPSAPRSRAAAAPSATSAPMLAFMPFMPRPPFSACSVPRAASGARPPPSSRSTRRSRDGACRRRSAARPRSAGARAARRRPPRAARRGMPLGVRPAARASHRLPDRLPAARVARARAMRVECLALSDRQHPRAQVGAGPQLWIDAQRGDERLLEAVLGVGAADRGDEQSPDGSRCSSRKRWKGGSAALM